MNVCVPPICYGNVVTGSARAAKERIDHNFHSAREQSGIAAGTGGFDIHVVGNTDLQGAAITSSAPPDKNRLTTGSLTYSDLTNTQVTQAESESMSVGYGGGSMVSTVAVNTLSNVLGDELGGRGLPEDKHESSTTLSVINPASVTITGTGSGATDAKSEEAVATLTTRDASTANAALSNALTLQQAQELKAQQEEARQNQIAANYVGAVLTHGIGDLAQQQGWAEGSWQKADAHQPGGHGRTGQPAVGYDLCQPERAGGGRGTDRAGRTVARSGAGRQHGELPRGGGTAFGGEGEYGSHGGEDDAAGERSKRGKDRLDGC